MITRFKRLAQHIARPAFSCNLIGIKYNMFGRQVVTHKKEIMTPRQKCDSLSHFCIFLIITKIELLHIPQVSWG